MASYKGIGVMSGTSLDGLDICYVEFTGDIETDVWGYRIERAVTVCYGEEWTDKLRRATKLAGVDLIKLHFDYGHFIGDAVKQFIEKERIKVDFVSSHGHTIFHQPESSFTFQLGDGETTSTYLQCPFVCNFRAKDLALGGQGAPLVPSGEKFLFSHADLCINLGGIANVGQKGRKGFDICPCNIVLNKLAKQFDGAREYDVDGEIASRGVVKDSLLQQLECLEYYEEPPPKSLGIEWIDKEIFPLLDDKLYTVADMQRTFVEHITNRIAKACADCSQEVESSEQTVLITGGGAFNKYLMNLLEGKLKQCGIKVQKTDDDTINFKEAMVFAFLGMRTLLGLDNVVSVVTGSRCDSVSGSIHRSVQPYTASPTIQDRFNYLMKRNSEKSATRRMSAGGVENV
ncbi:anhydro-N-acetylmuramic acid kinase-like [Haliotis cracherodii]|uniref:anhydro-N-acetylmuramic acid kinase-like n=1 Tax=Haliotis cracherodii TaxID=6455 RepID=UPI0039ECA864